MMHFKQEYNFFSSLENRNTRSKSQMTVVIVVAVLLVAGAVLMFLWGRGVMAQDERMLMDAQARLVNPDTLAKIAELDMRQAQLDSMDQYIVLAGAVLTRIGDANTASTTNLDALLVEMPVSIQVDSLSINGGTWHLECKTDTFTDIAVLLFNLENSPTFGSVMVGSVQTDENGISVFPLDFSLEGGMTDAAE